MTQETNLPTRPTREQILAALADMRARDLPTEGGAAFAYVYDPGERSAGALASEAFRAFLPTNGLDPTAFPSLVRLENEVVGFALAHLGGGPDAAGSFTSGGTESLILAVKTARDWARVHCPEVKEPELVLPVTAHAALHKAAHYLGVRAVVTPVDPATFKADVPAIRAAITPNTILIAASAASYAHGVVDPIAEIGALAHERGLLFHVDGCIGGFLLPYFRRLGAPVPAFDLSVPGVTSISMDFHKYGYAPKGASVVLYRDRALRRHQIYACAGWTGYTVVNNTIQSTKSGGPLAAVWALLQLLGDEGYFELARKTWEATRAIVAGIREVPGLRVLGDPEMSLVAFTSEPAGPAIFAVADEMKLRGWLIQPQLGGFGSPPNLHLTISAGHLAAVPKFLADLRAATAAAASLPADEGLSALLAMASAMDLSAMSDEALGQALALVGARGAELPERLAGINTLLDALPVPAREAALVAFWSDLYSARR